MAGCDHAGILDKRHARGEAGRVRLGIALVIALGMGAALTSLALLDNLVGGSRPYREIDRLVVLENRGPYVRGASTIVSDDLSWPDLDDLKAQQRTLSAVAGITSSERMVWDTGERVRSAWRSFVTPEFFEVLGARASLGRTFTRADFSPGAPRVAVITESMWRAQFGRSPAVVGQAVRVDGAVATLVGVVADDVVAFLRNRTEVFRQIEEAECVLMPIVSGRAGSRERMIEMQRRDRALPTVRAIARLRAGAGLAEAEREVADLSRRWSREFVETNGGRVIHAATLSDVRLRAVRQVPQMLLLLGLSAVVAAVASAAGLVMADAVQRQPEMAMRQALGASRGALVRLALWRTARCAVPGSVLGVVLAAWALAWLAPSESVDRTALSALSRPSVLASAAALSIFCVAALGGIGVWVLRQQNLTIALKEAGASTSGKRRRRTLRLVVAVQVATATALGFGSALLLRSMVKVLGVELGFVPGRAFVLRIDLPGDEFPSVQSQHRFFDQVLTTVRALPGVGSAGLSQSPPLNKSTVTAGGELVLEVPGRVAEVLAPLVVQRVSSGYFESLDIEIVRGRTFTAADAPNSSVGVLLSERFCRDRVVPGDPLATVLRVGGQGYPVVGVVKDIRNDGPLGTPLATLYTLIRPDESQSFGYLVVSPVGDQVGAMADVVRAVVSVDRRAVVAEPQSLARQLSRALEERERSLRLLMLSACVVLLLTVFSIRGVLSEFVENNVRQIAVRKALGATSVAAARLVWRQVTGAVAGGLAAGAFAGGALGRVMSSELFGVSPGDPTTALGTAGVLLVLGVAAAAGPIRRAIAVDPARALRNI